MDQIPAGGVGNVHAFAGITNRSCFMNQCKQRIKLFRPFPVPAESESLNGSDFDCVHEEVLHNPLVYPHHE